MSLRIKRTLFFVLPVLAFTFLAGLYGYTAMALGIDRPAPLQYVILPGVLLFTILIFLIRRLAKWAEIELYPLQGTSKWGPLWGFLIGVTASTLSALAYARTQELSIHIDLFKEALAYSSGLSVFPALTEEAVFRYGIVNGAAALAGPWAALAAGSVPFGLLHLIGNLMGGNLILIQTAGIALGGLLLSLVYLKWGLPSAILTHAVWNTLSIPWLKGMYLDPRTSLAYFEGAWTTCVILLVLCAALVVSLPTVKSRLSKKA